MGDRNKGGTSTEKERFPAAGSKDQSQGWQCLVFCWRPARRVKGGISKSADNRGLFRSIKMREEYKARKGKRKLKQ